MKHNTLPTFWELNNKIPPSFRFRGILTQDIEYQKSQCSQKIAKKLNDNISLSDYTNIVTSITCFFIIVTPDNLAHKSSKRFFKSEKNIRWKLRLNYQKILTANLEEVTSIIATAYLDAIKTYFKNFKHDFDGKRFYEDVRNLFEKEGWVQVANPISNV